MRKLLALGLFIVLLTISACGNPIEESNIDCTVTPNDPSCEIDQPVESYYCNEADLDCISTIEHYIDTLTLYEKTAQMIQAEISYITPNQMEEFGIGSVLSGGGSHPQSYDDTVQEWYDMYSSYQNAALESSSGIPIIYGIDAVHGNNNVYGATIFPHNINLGMANDADLMYRIGQSTAEEMLVTGINWTFAPAVSVVQDIRWGRTYEGYSENPIIQENLVQNMILGLQDNGVSATAKHYLADGGTYQGHDQGDVNAFEQEIRDIHLLPYYEAIEAGVDTIMISYSSINDIKMHSSSFWINNVLKYEMRYNGFVISDWNAIHQLNGDFKSQIITSVNAGVDMLMEPSDWQQALELLYQAASDGQITNDRIDDAVRRILTVKYYRGILEHPLYRLDESNLYNQEHQDLAREAARKSLVLLQNNEQSLPLSKTEKIFVAGPGADSVGLQSGGWTTYWQGNTSSDIGVGTSILDAVANVLQTTSGQLVDSVEEADTVIVVLAENPYAESMGDNYSMTLSSGNSHPDNQNALNIAAAAQAQGKNVVGILLSGRPLLLENYLNDFDSFIAAFLPGSEGGNAISDVVFGDENFSGKLSFTWPINYNQIGYTSNENDYDESIVLYPFGYGLTYE